MEYAQELAYKILKDSDNDIEESLRTIKNIELFLFREARIQKIKETISQLISIGLKQVTFKECLKMFDIETNLEVDEETFEDLLYGWDDEEDDYTQNQDYWNYSDDEDFIRLVKDGLEAYNGKTNFVILKNGWLQEIPEEHHYRVIFGDEELDLGGNE